MSSNDSMHAYEKALFKIRKSSLVLLAICAGCVELGFLFLFMVFTVPSFDLSPPLNRLFPLLVLGLFFITPLALARVWKKESAKPLYTSVSLEKHDLPRTIKTSMWGHALHLHGDSLQLVNKQNSENIEVFYRDIRKLDFSIRGAVELRIWHRKRLPLAINLSLVPRNDWPFILNTIIEQSSGVEFDSFASQVMKGIVPTDS